jgi:hypothetical protein
VANDRFIGDNQNGGHDSPTGGIANVSGYGRRVFIEGSHDQVTSGRASDEGLGSKMDFVILIVRLPTWECHDLLLSEQAILLDR